MSDIKGFDLDGYEPMTNAIWDLVNQFPRIQEDGEIDFATLSADSGKSMFPESGAAIISHRESVTGHVRQQCQFPFCVLYKAASLSANRKIKVKEWLDSLGRWLERQPVNIDGVLYQLKEYPEFFDNRKIKDIRRTSSGHMDGIEESGVEHWMIYLVVNYVNEYDI